MAKSEKVTSSSGNVFTDLGLPEADERLAKAEMVRIIRRILTERALTQRAAAEVLGLRQPDVSDLIRGKLARFSRERIERFLVLLGMDVSIRVATKGRRRSRGHLTVEGDRLVIQPSRLPRAGWGDAALQAVAQGRGALLAPLLPTRFDREEWSW